MSFARRVARWLVRAAAALSAAFSGQVTIGPGNTRHRPEFVTLWRNLAGLCLSLLAHLLLDRRCTRRSSRAVFEPMRQLPLA
jgi:hypothetical protein